MTDNSGKRTAAIDYAHAQIGAEYSLGAAGPNKFDCSGLTMRAWQAAGFSLPHNAEAQYIAVQKVPLAQAQPGDLLFFGGFNPAMGNPHHVGLFVSTGQMIDAPDYGIPVGVHNYNGYGDLMDSVGRMPVDGLTTPIISDVAATTPTASSGGGFTGTLSAVGVFVGKVTNGGLWKRVGLGALGVLILILAAKWVM